MKTRNLLVLVALFVSGCFPDLFGGGGSAPSSNGSDDFNAPPSRFAQCFGADEDIDYVMLAAAPAGDGETPVSKLGCIRYYERFEKGALVERGTRMAAGIMDPYFSEGANEIAYREREYFISRELLTATSSRIEIDGNRDGFVEQEVDAAYDGQGLIQWVITNTDRTWRRVVERRTLQRIDMENIRWTEETEVDGELVMTRNEVALAAMNTPLWSDPTCMADIKDPFTKVACTPEQEAKVKQALLELLPKAQDCMRSRPGFEKKDNVTNGKDLDLIAHLIKSQANNVVPVCFKGTAFAARARTNEGMPGVLVIDINFRTIDCQSTDYLKSTLFHEVLHYTRGPHSSELLRAWKEGKMTYQDFANTDGPTACEDFCFGVGATRCACARCLQTGTCDERCETQASCRVDGPDGQAIRSDAVGAMCVSAPGYDKSPLSWHGSMTECQSQCSSSGKCTSYTLSCTKSCN